MCCMIWQISVCDDNKLVEQLAVQMKDSDAENRRRKVDRVKWSVVCHFVGCLYVKILV